MYSKVHILSQFSPTFKAEISTSIRWGRSFSTSWWQGWQVKVYHTHTYVYIYYIYISYIRSLHLQAPTQNLYLTCARTPEPKPPGQVPQVTTFHFQPHDSGPSVILICKGLYLKICLMLECIPIHLSYGKF